MADQIDALAAIAAGRSEAGVAALRAVAAREAALPVDFGPPEILKPSEELLGDVLLGLGRPAEAEAAYDRALRQAPGRRLATLGKARAAGGKGGRGVGGVSGCELPSPAFRGRGSARRAMPRIALWIRADGEGLAESTE
jgi:hypothetical protein